MQANETDGNERRSTAMGVLRVFRPICMFLEDAVAPSYMVLLSTPLMPMLSSDKSLPSPSQS